MKRVNVAVMVVLSALALASCGGGDEEASSDAPAPTTTSVGAVQADDASGESDIPDLEQTATTVGSISDTFDTAGGLATVTIGDETWELQLVEEIPMSVCDSDFFGGFVAILVNEGADLTSPSDLLNVMLPGGDFTDPPSVELNLAKSGGAEWIADETIYERNADLPEGLGVTEFSIDGGTASGSGVFFEQESFYQFNAGTGDLVVADGTFTVTCAGDE